MEADRFDRMTVAFVTGRSRRSLLASLVAASAALLGLSGLDTDLEAGIEAEARGRKRSGKGKGNDNKKKRRKRRRRKKNEDKDQRECSTDGDCPPPQVCNAASGQCFCSQNCCADSDCPPGFNCFNVNNSFNCFPAG